MRSLSVLLVLTLGFVTLIGNADEEDITPSALQWSPNGIWVAQGYMDGHILITSVDNSSQFVELKLESAISDIAWSHDSTRLAVGLYANENISIWDVAAASLIKTLQGDKVYEGGGMYLDWNPKQEILVSVADEWDGGRPLRFWSTETYSQIGLGKPLVVYPITSTVKWSPDGKQLAVATVNQGLRLYDVFQGENIAYKHLIEGLPFPGGISYMDWSPDGTQLAILKYETRFVTNEKKSLTSAEQDSFMVILDAVTLEEVFQVTQLSHNEMDPFLWSPDGERIAILHPTQVDVINAQTGVSLEQFSVDAYNFNAAWSPFGGRLAIAEAPEDNILKHASNVQGMQFVVPAPSPELLDSIETVCVPAKAISKLPVAEMLATDTMSADAYVQAVQADLTIPAGCAADLIAVAEALQAEQESR